VTAYADNDVMTPHHPLWDEFIDLLSRWVTDNGCRAIKRAHPGVHCVMRSMGFTDEDVLITRGFLLAYGGGCDCEVLMNVAPSFEEAMCLQVCSLWPTGHCVSAQAERA
jgi:hypothetical protein